MEWALEDEVVDVCALYRLLDEVDSHVYVCNSGWWDIYPYYIGGDILEVAESV